VREGTGVVVSQAQKMEKKGKKDILFCFFLVVVVADLVARGLCVLPG
jgi:hypothetical protein